MEKKEGKKIRKVKEKERKKKKGKKKKERKEKAKGKEKGKKKGKEKKNWEGKTQHMANDAPHHALWEYHAPKGKGKKIQKETEEKGDGIGKGKQKDAYKKLVIANIVPNFVAMATAVGREKCNWQHLMAHSSKPFTGAKISQISLTRGEF